MSESENAPSVDSMLNADLSGVDTNFPVLEPQVVDCVIVKMVSELTKEKKSPVLSIGLKTLTPVKTTKGDLRNAGFPLRTMVSLTPTEKYDPRQRLAQIKEAVFGEKAGAFGDVNAYIGQNVTVRIAIESSAEYGDQNVIKAFVKKQ